MEKELVENGRLLEAALKYLNLGLNVIPLGKNKKPLIAWTAYETRHATEAEVNHWWGVDFTGANIGIVTGQTSNIDVVDCDTATAEAAFIRLFGGADGISRVRTPQGGAHFYFRYEPEMRNRVRFLPGIDLRGQGGYVVAPPSFVDFEKENHVRVKGAYEWEVDNLSAGLPTMPPELLNLLSRNGPGYQRPEGPPLVQGHRDEDLFHMAYSLLRDGVPADEVLGAVLAAARACTPPFTENEARAKFRSALDRYQKLRAQTEDTPTLVRRKCSDIEDTPILWLWKDVVPMGMVTAITGEPGISKTFVAADLAARVSAGTPFPEYQGQTPSVTGSVLYICSEGLPESILKPRFRAAGADLGKIDIVEAIHNGEGKPLQFDVTKHLPLLESAVTQSRDLRLIVIDPIASFLPPKISDIASTQVRHAMDHISAFAAKTRIAVVVVMHFNKDLSQKAIYRTSGSVQFMAAVKSSWAVVHRKGDPDNRRLLVPQKSNIAHTEQSLPFSIEDYSYDAPMGRIKTAKIRYEAPIRVDVDEVVSPQSEPTISKTAAARQFLREQLRDGRKGQRELRQLAEEQGIPKHALWRAKDDLHVVDERDGYQGRSYWRLPQPDEET